MAAEIGGVIRANPALGAGTSHSAHFSDALRR